MLQHGLHRTHDVCTMSYAPVLCCSMDCTANMTCASHACIAPPLCCGCVRACWCSGLQNQGLSSIQEVPTPLSEAKPKKKKKAKPAGAKALETGPLHNPLFEAALSESQQQVGGRDGAWGRGWSAERACSVQEDESAAGMGWVAGSRCTDRGHLASAQMVCAVCVPRRAHCAAFSVQALANVSVRLWCLQHLMASWLHPPCPADIGDCPGPDAHGARGAAESARDAGHEWVGVRARVLAAMPALEARAGAARRKRVCVCVLGAYAWGMRKCRAMQVGGCVWCAGKRL